MPRLVAYKHSEWTGKVVWVEDGSGKTSGTRVVLLGVAEHGNLLIGRVPGTKILWQFQGYEAPFAPGLPSWCHIVRTCIVCGHEEQPLLRGHPWCSRFAESGEIELCCNGACTYAEVPP